MKTIKSNIWINYRRYMDVNNIEVYVPWSVGQIMPTIVNAAVKNGEHVYLCVLQGAN